MNFDETMAKADSLTRNDVPRDYYSLRFSIPETSRHCKALRDLLKNAYHLQILSWNEHD